jgi:predicted transcriptional regulator
MDVLLSIKPEYSDRIFAGEKRYEFRRVIPKQPIERVIVYSSSPVQRIVGEFTVGGVVTASPEQLWRRTRQRAGIPRESFMRYFAGRDQAHALVIDVVRRYREPIDPRRSDRGFRPPQSFVYVPAEQASASGWM